MSRKVYDKKRKRSKGFRLLASAPPALYMMIILMILFSFFADHYFAWSNLSVILRQAAPLMMLACGQTLIILMQGTDLSLGSIVSLTSVLWIWLLNMGFGMPVSILLIILAGALCGLLNGLIVGKGLLPVFIVTLGTQNIFKSAALLLCGSQTIYYRHDLFRTGIGGYLPDDLPVCRYRRCADDHHVCADHAVEYRRFLCRTAGKVYCQSSRNGSRIYPEAPPVRQGTD